LGGFEPGSARNWIDHAMELLPVLRGGMDGGIGQEGKRLLHPKGRGGGGRVKTSP